MDRHNRIDCTCMILYVFCMNMTRAQDSCPIVAGISNCLSVRIFTVSPRKQGISDIYDLGQMTTTSTDLTLRGNGDLVSLGEQLTF